MGVATGIVKVIDVYLCLLTRLEHFFSKCGGLIVPRYQSRANVVAKLLFSKKHASIQHVRPFVVKGNHVLF